MQTAATPTTNERPAITEKLMVWETNYNNKLDCTGMIHLDTKPSKGLPPRSVLENTIFQIKTDDNSHPPVRYRLIDMVPVKLWQVPASFTLASHGMDFLQFQEWIISKHPSYFARDPLECEVVVYQYQRCVDI